MEVLAVVLDLAALGATVTLDLVALAMEILGLADQVDLEEDFLVIHLVRIDMVDQALVVLAHLVEVDLADHPVDLNLVDQVVVLGDLAVQINLVVLEILAQGKSSTCGDSRDSDQNDRNHFNFTSIIKAPSSFLGGLVFVKFGCHFL